MEINSENKIFGGRQVQFKHASAVNNCEMTCSIFLPPQSEQGEVPVLYWLSGLTCTDENFVTKAGAQRYAAEHGVAIVAPDTSPRGEDVPDDQEGGWDFGLGAGFYVTATEEPWSTHYHMYEYIVDELPKVVNENFPVDGSKQSIFGHSMGGHGALTIALKNPDKYVSVSAFAPIVSPLNCPWGEKALGNYIGANKKDWEQYDTCSLVRQATEKKFSLLVDQGLADNFLEEQLKPELLREACSEADYELNLRMQEGYDHSYYFIASFIGEHIAFHKDQLSRA
jgi:S-formylglutathione hydrolase